MTEMACEEDRMASEAAFLAALPRTTSVARNGDSLVLTGPELELRFALVAPVANANLIGTTWILDSLVSGEVASSTVGEHVTLALNGDGTISASTGCRDITGRYTIAEGRSLLCQAQGIVITSLPRTCPAPMALMASEADSRG
jgi:heat shock protein HslJ